VLAPKLSEAAVVLRYARAGSTAISAQRVPRRHAGTGVRCAGGTTLSPRCSHLRRVFIHEDGCPRYEPAAGFPPALREGRLTFNGYGADRALVARERTESAAEVDGAIDRLLADDGVDYVHVRSTSAGCFLCRLDRAA
jgi:hypothetical protein